MKSGDLNNRVEVLRAVDAPDELNAAVLEWPDPPAFSCWAGIASAGSAPRVVAEQFRAEVSHVVTVRAGLDVRAGDRLRVVGSGAVLHILAISNPDAQGVARVLQCREVLGE